jgi:hypothetical protein
MCGIETLMKRFVAIVSPFQGFKLFVVQTQGIALGCHVQRLQRFGFTVLSPIGSFRQSCSAHGDCPAKTEKWFNRLVESKPERPAQDSLGQSEASPWVSFAKKFISPERASQSLGYSERASHKTRILQC